ncbi:UDP-2,3-diacylglucosamine diphosphatase [Limnohabitans sp. Bal53]|uniref:UDP-2,3-diacylglucosamine diphosphatase n=1 Tax=Limnohabitans sp. Bal53 TaxID=1977910 RepID=UPI000D39CB60|nr:UDP-2,3-diacylglucosamine diphosphatase [Limnohabitans sp. Bal53]PUE42320.1 UDP-2,3-diacylglucosamine diphosphatase [Limnohabitans sp. Bal53]
MSADPRTTAPNLGRLTAPAAWQTVDLISDLHLQASETATFEAWRDYMASTAADAVLILGDLFEVWVGDDAVESDLFLQTCAQVLRQTAQRLHVAFMPGNRDFLVGPAFLSNCGVHALSDPSVLHWGEQRILLTHGDALCLDDRAYQVFRQQVRHNDWQTEFLAKPLHERLGLARAMRAQSESQKHKGMVYADADVLMALNWLHAAGADRLVHGHTHKPADHLLGTGHRHVLSDWSLDHAPTRAQVFRLRLGGDFTRMDLTTSAKLAE